LFKLQFAQYRAPQVHVIPPQASRPRHLWYALVLALLVTLPRAILIREAHSQTSDDDYHLVRGLEFLQRDPGLVNRELNDPPLGQAIAALPLWIMGGTTHGRDEGTAIYGQTAYSPETALMAVAIWKVLLFLPLVAVVFCWCRQLYGLPAAWFGVSLLLFEPTITAHLHLAALDVISTSGIVCACFFGWRYFERPSVGRMILASGACAVALLLKHTAILVPAIFCGYGLLDWFHRRAVVADTLALRNGMLKGALLALVAMWLLLWLDLSPVRQAGAMPGGLYISSVLDARDHVKAPNDAYLWGDVRRGGWWYYFPAVAAYKVPIAIALILTMGLASLARVRPRWQEWALVLPMIWYVVFLLCQNINIGWRHFLPAYVFMLLAASRCMAAGLTWRVLGWAAIGVTAIDIARWHPDYIAYINWPRPDVYQAISDSNIDWGQGLKQANDWLDANPAFIAGRPVYVRASAVSNRAVRHYLGRRVIQLHAADVCPAHGVLILSPVSLSGISESEDDYASLRGVAPHAVIGHSLRVYDLDAPGH
jgi:4-amino-4-deoxy-L-arabinose transferase-like glycosyltransferase